MEIELILICCRLPESILLFHSSNLCMMSNLSLHVFFHIMMTFQGIVYMILAMAAFANMMAFIATGRHCFLYLGVAFTISVGAYLGFYRTQISKKFNIRVSNMFLHPRLWLLLNHIYLFFFLQYNDEATF